MPESGGFVEAAEPFRRELVAHCYRMLGSIQDAEDLVQETYLRAWRSYAGFEGRSSLRTWLYQIATNRCLTELAKTSRRMLPSGVSDPERDPDARVEAVGAELRWLQPAPDAMLIPDGADPAAIVAAREGLRLALIASLQYLPPAQRAVLVLRDVLAFPATEVAVMLGTTTASVKSALQRARTRLADLTLTDGQITAPADPRARQLLDQYITAFEHADAAALERLLLQDAALEATPLRTWFAGRDTCIPFLRDHLLGSPGDWRMLATRANGQPAAAAYIRDRHGHYLPYGICVLTMTNAGISRISSFGEPRLVSMFGFGADSFPLLSGSSSVWVTALDTSNEERKPIAMSVPSTMRALQQTSLNGPADLRLITAPVPVPGPGEVLLRVTAAGVNFVDISQARGTFAGGPQPPYLAGIEGAGEVAAVGVGVTDLELGTHVVGVGIGGGAFAEYVVLPAAATVRVPEGWSDEQALGLLVSWPTALAALKPLGGLAAGQTVLIHAAAGGTGQAAVKIAKHHGATVIATASPSKHGVVRSLGADHVLDSSSTDLAADVVRLSGGAAVDLVLESVGGATLEASLTATKRVTGRVVVYGLAGGEASITNWDLVYKHQVHVVGLNIGILIQATPQIYGEVMGEIFGLIAAGVLGPAQPTTYALADGPEALADLESRTTIGKLALLP